jgi:CRP-like cAMP-binding protein
MRTDPTGAAIRNILLLALPDEEFSLLRPHLEPVDLPHHRILHEQGEKIDFAYFPNSGMTSMVVLAGDGRSVEVALVGHEGMVGTPLVMSLKRAPYRAIMQIGGQGVRINAETLTQILPAATCLQLKLGRFILVQGLQMAQLAACNRLHELEQRLSRWLLMCQDRVDTPQLNLTHEFLAQMLGTGRPSVSLALGMLERAGVIENLRGSIRIVNRKGLEETACECYDVVQNFNGNLGLR